MRAREDLPSRQILFIKKEREKERASKQASKQACHWVCGACKLIYTGPTFYTQFPWLRNLWHPSLISFLIGAPSACFCRDNTFTLPDRLLSFTLMLTLHHSSISHSKLLKNPLLFLSIMQFSHRYSVFWPCSTFYFQAIFFFFLVQKMPLMLLFIRPTSCFPIGRPTAEAVHQKRFPLLASTYCKV